MRLEGFGEHPNEDSGNQRPAHRAGAVLRRFNPAEWGAADGNRDNALGPGEPTWRRPFFGITSEVWTLPATTWSAKASRRRLTSARRTSPPPVLGVTVYFVRKAIMEIKKVGVLGCGLMGSGIAQVCATAGFDVTVLEVEQKFLDKGFAGIEKSLARFAERPVEKGGITAEQRDAIRARLKGTTNKSDLADCDIVIEAIIENVDEKKKMYASIDGIVKKGAIFASNTSSISVTELLTSVKRPERFVGLHFFNPVPLMKLVEVVRTIATADEVYEAAYEFGKKLGKVPVRTSDKTGFIVNRLLVPYLLDAIRAYEEGVGSIEDIDNAMKLGCGYPMGPLTLLDFVGLDTTYYITHVMYDEFKERRFASPPLLKRMVMAGWYGRKSGRGFYDYADPEKPRANRL
jgi:3-hydroxybutyryl-CoA dehydrogenase